MAWRLVGVGWYIPTCLILGAVLGHLLDNKFHTEPWLALVGVTLGLAVALLGLYLMIKPLMNEDNEGKDKEKK